MAAYAGGSGALGLHHRASGIVMTNPKRDEAAERAFDEWYGRWADAQTQTYDSKYTYGSCAAKSWLAAVAWATEREREQREQALDELEDCACHCSGCHLRILDLK